MSSHKQLYKNKLLKIKLLHKKMYIERTILLTIHKQFNLNPTKPAFVKYYKQISYTIQYPFLMYSSCFIL